ncbi:MAG: aminotransferase class I/II-fold pyridoxal phosphate-dependent enzyme, partial [Geminicoccaceae bacterium]
MLDRVYRRTQLQDHELHPSTQMMSYGYDPFMSEGAVKPPVFLTSTFAFRTAEEGAAFFDVVAGRKPTPEGESAGLVYSRFNHPNLEIVEDRLALLDGAEAAAVTSSGMAAISAAFLALLKSGDVIVHSTPLYGGTETLIRKNLAGLGIKAVPFVDGLDADGIAKALDRAASLGSVKVFYIEAPANPTNALIDFAIVQRALDAFEQN